MKKYGHRGDDYLFYEAMGVSMSRRDFPLKQYAKQEADLNPPVGITRQTVTTSKDISTSIRPLHLLILGGLSALGPLSTDMYLPALPTISHDLGTTTSQTQLTLSAAILGLSLGQMIAGPISDALGRRWPLFIGIIVYVFTSLLCIIAPSVTILTILRALQGMAGAAGIVIALAIARDLYSGIALARFFSLLMAVQGIAPIIAPVIGSQLLIFTSWHGIFVTMAIIGVGLLLAVSFGIGETLPSERRETGGISATFTAFGDLLTDRRFIGYALSCGLAFAAGITYISGSPFILQNVYGLSPQIFGIIFAINALGLVIMSQISAKLVSRSSPQNLLRWGVTIIAIAGLTLLVVVLSGIGLTGILPLLFVITASLGLIAPNATTLALTNTRIAGSASALLGVLQFSIGAIAAPLVGLAGTSTAIPMVSAIAIFGIATLATFLIFCRPIQSNKSHSQPLTS
jgi:MFS transporter, DHA1 family, multidrug resistance protein